jgi:STE24 endopeptidase
VLLAAAVVLWPLAVEPLFHRFAPLPPGEIQTATARIMERAGLEPGEILVVDASRRTSRVSAYVTGLGRTQRVVLYDTLIRGVPAREVAVIAAHEIAHRSRRHLLIGTALACAGCMVAFPAAAWILARAGWPGGRPQGPGFVAGLVFVLLLFATAFQPLSNAVSRRMEAEADAVARSLVEDPRAPLDARVRLARLNLADPYPPTWVKVLLYEHPTLPERIAAAELDSGTQPGVDK